MSSNRYQIYLENTYRLAETLVIKSEASAEALNRWVREFGQAPVDETDPTSWKYYLNIAGRYHPTDTPMTVVSLDTLELINFTQEALQIHRATWRGYAYGSREYRQLVARYPQQEMLILGILYPVDQAQAVAAADGAVLGWPQELIEVNEYSLVANLQRWVDHFRVRWCNQQYGVSDDLYHATYLGLLYLNLVPAILNLRLAACKTNEAHSFHVREYLASHGMLDQYLEQLTLRQALFLYRNIAYIERNSGQRNIFDWLVEHIMTERHLPLAEFVMRHDLSLQPGELLPQVLFSKDAINAQQTITGDEIQTLEQLLLKEDELARDNPLERQDHQAAIQQLLENSPSNVVQTKVLESAMWDYTNATPYPLTDVLINHWLWLASEGIYYQAVVSITNPKTGERIPMMVKDAFVFMWYAFCASVGIQLETVPALYAKRVQRIPTPSVDDLMSVVDSRVVPRALAEQARATQPRIYSMISTEAFYNKCTEIYRAANTQLQLLARQEHQLRHGMTHAMISRLWSDNICHLAPAEYNYEDWFAERNIRIADFTRKDLEAAYVSITRDATGMSLHTTPSLAQIQKAMIRLLGQLSSYTVQFLSMINEVDITVGNESMIAVGDRFFSQYDTQRLQELEAQPLRLRGQTARSVHLDTGVGGIQEVVHQSQHEERELLLEPMVHWDTTGASVTYARQEAAPIYISAGEDRSAVDEQARQQGLMSIYGIETILGLTATQRGVFKDVYRQYWG